MKTYAVSDLHGCYNLYKQIYDFIKPEDIVIFLGDAADRGPDGWRIIKEIYKNPQWIYLKGNHEDMLIKAMKYLVNDSEQFRFSEDPYSLCVYNGGRKTLKDWIEDGKNINWITRLNDLKTCFTYFNDNAQEIVLTHAGFTDKGMIPEDTETLLWDRYHFYNPVKFFETDRIIVHGHTPIPYLAKVLRTENTIDTNNLKPLWYCNNHKVDIDCGSVVTHQTVLLDLDTFEYYNFKEEEDAEA